MKKLLSLALCAVMLMPLALTAFADEPLPDDPLFYMHSTGGSEPGAEPQAYCTTHTWDYANPSITTGSRQTYPSDITCCAYPVVYTFRCRNCPATMKETRGYQNILTHNYNRGLTSSCNGTTQSLTYGCAYGCPATTIRTQRCPGAGHSSNYCRWLPF